MLLTYCFLLNVCESNGSVFFRNKKKSLKIFPATTGLARFKRAVDQLLISVADSFEPMVSVKRAGRICFWVSVVIASGAIIGLAVLAALQHRAEHTEIAWFMAGKSPPPSSFFLNSVGVCTSVLHGSNTHVPKRESFLLHESLIFCLF